MKRPNLFILGGQKCGTSALAHFLSQHPDICLAQGKEAHIFDNPDIDIYDAEQLDITYQGKFTHANGQRYYCDATPIYAYWSDLLPAIHNYQPDAKIIFMLRDPVERAISHYMMESGRAAESLSISRAFLSEAKRLRQAGHDRSWNSVTRVASYLDRGRFSQQVAAINSVFPEKNILFLHNDSLRYQHQATLNKVCHFLDIEPISIAPENVFSGQYQAKSFSYHLAYWFAKWTLRQEVNFVRQFQPKL